MALGGKHPAQEKEAARLDSRDLGAKWRRRIGLRKTERLCRLAVHAAPDLGKGGTGVLYLDGKEVARNSLEHTTPITFPEDETFDIGEDTRTGVAMLDYRYDAAFKFSGKITKLTFELEPVKPTKAEQRQVTESVARSRD